MNKPLILMTQLVSFYKPMLRDNFSESDKMCTRFGNGKTSYTLVIEGVLIKKFKGVVYL